MNNRRPLIDVFADAVDRTCDSIANAWEWLLGLLRRPSDRG